MLSASLNKSFPVPYSPVCMEVTNFTTVMQALKLASLSGRNLQQLHLYQAQIDWCSTLCQVHMAVLEWNGMNECLTTPQHEKQISYWVSEKGKRMKWLYMAVFTLTSRMCPVFSSVGSSMEYVSLPVSSRESAFCPSRYCNGTSPIPIRLLRWIRS